MNTEYSGDRRARPLRRAELDPDPLRQFESWFAEAGRAVQVPEAMALATATRDGAPSARVVLLKQADERGFVFYTNYESRKGEELAENPRAALLFHWHPLGRQVRIEGPVERISRKESEAYFKTRPLAAQLAAGISKQSRPLASRLELENRVLRSGKAPVEHPLPPWWGGFRLVPEAYEFWQHREDRLHDRFHYRREDGAWVIERLSP